MPFKECLRLDDDQSFTPIEEPGKQDHERARGRGGTSRLDLAFLKQCELFAKEQILGNDCSVGRKEQPDKSEQLQILQELPSLFPRSSDLIIAEHRIFPPAWRTSATK